MTRWLLLALGLVGFGPVGFGPPTDRKGDVASDTAPSAVDVGGDNYVRGVALGLFATDAEWDYGDMVAEIRRRGATDVLVVVNAYQHDRFATDIAPAPGRSPSLATVGRTLRAVRAAGMRASLMPVVRLARRGEGGWRGRILPVGGVPAWFNAYGRFVLPLAELAERAGAARFVVGSELGSLEAEHAHWTQLIAQIRTRFTGRLTYSANWDRAVKVPFWSELDEIGTTAYFPLRAAGASPSQVALARAWRRPSDALQALSARLGRPVLVTEVGYVSQHHAGQRPWDDTRNHAIDQPLQARLYTAFCDALMASPAVQGFFVWNWFGLGGPRDAGFTPRGKPAASALGRCFAKSPATAQLSRNVALARAEQGDRPR